MKKILAILIMLVALLASCDDETAEQKQERLQRFSTDTFCEVEYKGHSYIMFLYGRDNQGYSGLTHNPDCPCKKGGNDETE
jgi:hypothetical protein